MRASIGLGLIVVGLAACTVERRIIEVGPDNGTSTDATEPTPPADPTDPDNPPAPIVPNIAISEVAVFQGVKVAVAEAGELVPIESRNAPVVANRPGIVRVYVTPGAGWRSREVTAELRLVAGDTKFPILRETKRIKGPSTDEDLDSTFNIEVPPDHLPPGVEFQVSLTSWEDGERVPEGVEHEGRFPLDGTFADLGARHSGKLKVVLVPIQYEADGSGRTPDLGEEQLERYRTTLMRLYPTHEVELTVHEPYPWRKTIAGNGTGFTEALQAMFELRRQDEVERDVYYYGLLAPTTSLKAFCSRGCVMGLSTLVSEKAASMRASVGVGFTGQESANTMAHEIGHAHGREHAPCGGPRGVDADYPYPSAQLGVWGWDIFTKKLVEPTKGRDIMGYCPNEWISDYTYNGLFERMVAVTLDKATTAPPSSSDGSAAERASAARRYRIARVGTAGDLAWSGDIELDEELGGGTVLPTHFLSENGVELTTKPGRFYPFDHLPGGFLFIPDEAEPLWRSIRVEGFTTMLTR